ncbi:hypothetical protein CHUAL_002927 [Chamberlinius hualienensis]
MELMDFSWFKVASSAAGKLREFHWDVCSFLHASVSSAICICNQPFPLSRFSGITSPQPSTELIGLQ